MRVFSNSRRGAATIRERPLFRSTLPEVRRPIERIRYQCMRDSYKWRPQDLREGGAKTFAREARAQNF